MNKENSVIGCGYIPRNALAVCLKTNANTELGKVVYKIIKDPYERVFEYQDIFGMMMSRRQKRMAVNVLDTNTGLTYAVEYKPANLERTTPESGADKPGEPCDFATRAEQITGELKVMFDPAGNISDKCGVAFFAISDDGNNETSTCMCFLGGRGDRVAKAIASACSQNPQALEVIKHASVEAILRRMFAGSEKKE